MNKLQHSLPALGILAVVLLTFLRPANDKPPAVMEWDAEAWEEQLSRELVRGEAILVTKLIFPKPPDTLVQDDHLLARYEVLIEEPSL